MAFVILTFLKLLVLEMMPNFNTPLACVLNCLLEKPCVYRVPSCAEPQSLFPVSRGLSRSLVSIPLPSIHSDSIGCWVVPGAEHRTDRNPGSYVGDIQVLRFSLDSAIEERACDTFSR